MSNMIKSFIRGTCVLFIIYSHFWYWILIIIIIHMSSDTMRFYYKWSMCNYVPWNSITDLKMLVTYLHVLVANSFNWQMTHTFVKNPLISSFIHYGKTRQKCSQHKGGGEILTMLMRHHSLWKTHFFSLLSHQTLKTYRLLHILQGTEYRRFLMSVILSGQLLFIRWLKK